MTQISLSDLLDPAQVTAEHMMCEHGQVFPFVLCSNEDGEVVSLGYDPPPTHIQRSLQAIQIGNRMREEDVKAYAVAHEVWVSNDNSFGSPTKDPNLSEAVLIEAYNVATSEFRMFQIDRAIKPYQLLPDENYGKGVHVGPGGTWNNLLADPGKVH